MRRTLPLLPLLLLPAALLRASWVAERFPGQSFGEGWGRLFAAGQVARWLTGAAAPGHGDLLNHPDGMVFWPVDPLTTLLEAAIGLLGGGGATADAAALTITMGALMVTTGLGAWLLARALGAGPWSACAGALALQLHPFLLRSAADTVMEVLALGPLLLLGYTLLRAWRAWSRSRGLAILGAMALTALTSPYFAVYALLLFGALAPWALWRQHGRRWLTLFAPLLVGALLAAIPLLAAESGPQGRMADRFGGGGMRLAPSAQVVLAPDGRVRSAPRERRPVHLAPAEGAEAPPIPALPAVQRLLRRFPGGLACLLALGVGLASRRGRPLALVALALFLLGAGPTLVRHLFSPGASDLSSPLQEVLQALPLTSRLGNAQRLILLYAIPAALAGAVGSAGRRLPGGLLVVLALIEAALAAPGLRLPSTALALDETLLAAIDGPVVTFPCGDPPTWHRDAPPKRDLYLATRHGQAVPGSYGRVEAQADDTLQATLSAWATVPVAADLAHRERARLRSAGDPAGFAVLLVLHESLDEGQRSALRPLAQERWGPPLATSAWGSLYRLQPEE